MKPVIEVKHVSKIYYIKHRRKLFREEIEKITLQPLSWFKNRRKINEEKQKEFWALKDVSFTINQGEIVGFIGPNGTGKSTLLKIISKIIAPTKGEVRVRGRVGSLLELGAAFHSDLTGRENIYLSGSIYGLSRKAITSKFDEIVSFAGVGQFIDMPVKFYSSGMYIRLAFSVAAELQTDILLIDEVLTVGDAEFQRKSLNKLEQLAKTQGRTVLLVSHNMSALRTLCTHGIYLNNGTIQLKGSIGTCIDNYLNRIQTTTNQFAQKRDLKNDLLEITAINIVTNKGTNTIKTSDPLIFDLTFCIRKKIRGVVFGISVNTLDSVRIMEFRNIYESFNSEYNMGTYTIRCHIDKTFLFSGKYIIGVGARSSDGVSLDYLPAATNLTVKSDSNKGTDPWVHELSGFINLSSRWTKPKKL